MNAHIMMMTYEVGFLAREVATFQKKKYHKFRLVNS